MAQRRLGQAEAIADPAVRAATIRTLHSAAVADEARAQTLAEQVQERVLQDGLTDPAQIPIREWVALDAERRQAIEDQLHAIKRGLQLANKMLPAKLPDAARWRAGCPGRWSAP
ncbi:MAG: hypothetical protein KF889_14765 [Alphaproteobacteria bacterium]|nr:hypothetical protein [Alphaproteobacteria bacterium]MCW5743702.1 hypothetical protein [Alphaproteobacteria bacterium]